MRMSWKSVLRPLVGPLAIVLSKYCPSFRDSPYVMDIIMGFHKKGDYKTAYNILSRAVKGESRLSKVADIYILLAELELWVNKNAHKAIKALDKAQKMGCTQMAYYYTRRGEALWLTGEHQMALQCFESSVAAEPCAFYRSNLALALSEMDDERALSLWKEVLEEEPENSLAHTYLGFEAAKSGDRDKALLMAKKAHKSASLAREFVALGRLYYELGEFQTVVERYLEAMKLGYDRGWLCAGIADCYLSMGQAKLAQKYLKRALKYSPNDEYVKEIQRDYEQKSMK